MNIEEALNTALQYENRVVGVYEEAAQASTDPVGQRIFQTLANEERFHVKYLEDRKAEWQKTGKVTVAKIDTIVPSRERIDEAVQSLKAKVSTESPENETRLLKRCLDVEVETSNFYISVVKQLPSEDQKLFERFVEIEQGHQAIVQAEIDAVTGSGYWFDMPEISMEA
jgi:rubrerythrin